VFRDREIFLLTVVGHSFCLRSSSADPSLFLRSADYRINGLTTDLQRYYNGLTAYERNLQSMMLNLVNYISKYKM